MHAKRQVEGTPDARWDLTVPIQEQHVGSPRPAERPSGEIQDRALAPPLAAAARPRPQHSADVTGQTGAPVASPENSERGEPQNDPTTRLRPHPPEPILAPQQQNAAGRKIQTI